jgi:hypothetical protein
LKYKRSGWQQIKRNRTKLSSNNSNAKKLCAGLEQTGGVRRCGRRTVVYIAISSTNDESGIAEVPNDLENPAPSYTEQCKIRFMMYALHVTTGRP